MNRLLRALGIIFLLLIITAGLVTYAAMDRPTIAKNSVLQLNFDGALPERTSRNLVSLVRNKLRPSLSQLTQTIRTAAGDERVVGLVLNIRDGSMGLAQLAELHDAIRAFKKAQKFTLAYLQTAGELGQGDRAYALACAADRVYLSPAGEINLSGLRAEVPFVKETLRRLKVQPFVEQRYEFKNFANTFTQDSFTPEHLSALKGVLDDLQQALLQLVAEGRGKTVSEALTWVTDAPWSSGDALEHKLVDRVGYWDEVEDDLTKQAKADDPLLDIQAYADRLNAPKGKAQVAYIVGSGEISTGDNGKGPLETSDKMGADTLVQAFVDARAAGSKAVVFRVDSPGGSYVASDLIRREVERTRREGIPVVVSMGNVAASGGYLIATDADHIVAEPGTITGSIGVFAASFAVREALSHFLGLHFGVYETVPHPGNLNMLDPPAPADRARVARVLDRIYREFVTKVADTRHKKYDEVHALARGHIWSGRQAVQNGLADEVGGIETALAYVRERLKLGADAPLDLVSYPRPDSAFDVLRDYFDASSRVSTVAPAQLVRAGLHALAGSLNPGIDAQAVRLPYVPQS